MSPIVALSLANNRAWRYCKGRLNFQIDRQLFFHHHTHCPTPSLPFLFAALKLSVISTLVGEKQGKNQWRKKQGKNQCRKKLYRTNWTKNIRNMRINKELLGAWITMSKQNIHHFTISKSSPQKTKKVISVLHNV